MSATGFLDACGFTPVSSGTGNFVVSASVQGYQTPASAGAVNATVYSYRAESPDKSQWEEGFGAYTVSGTTLARTTITANSSGGTSAISFSAAPNVYITAATADLTNASLLTSGTLAAARLPFSASPITNSLSADVALSSTTSTFTDGPSVAQGTSGTWLATGSVVVTDTATGAIISCKLWDGTTVIASGSINAPATTNTRAHVALSGFITNPAGNIRISVANLNGDSTSAMRFSNTGLGKDCTVTAVRIA